jgi:hypothetical protein
MATYNKFESWVEYMVEGADCGSDTFKVAFTAQANPPSSSADSLLGDITAVSTTNLDTVTLTTTTASETSGTYTLDFQDLIMTASGAVGPFQYVVIYDDTVANDPLVSWFDYGSEITMQSGDTFTLTFNASGLFTVT